MDFVAHSVNKTGQTQKFCEHVHGMTKLSDDLLSLKVKFIEPKTGDNLRRVANASIRMHDVGKLVQPNQNDLLSNKGGKLSVQHVEPGMAFLGSLRKSLGHRSLAVIAHICGGHHVGMEDFSFDVNYLRDKDSTVGWDDSLRVCDYSDANLDLIEDLIQKALDSLDFLHGYTDFEAEKPTSVFLRMGESVLVHADHNDTASFYGNIVTCHGTSTLNRIPERIAKLDEAVAKLQSQLSKRNSIRMKLYNICRKTKLEKFNLLQSPPGSGKTIAAIRMCLGNGATKIIYVSPYISTTRQTFNVFDAVVLDDEDHRGVVGENHSQFNFDESKHKDVNIFQKQMSSEWTAPIICTTSVQFTETLSSNHPRKLKKFSQIIGSHIIIDEYHTIPPTLLPVILAQLKELVENYGCKVIFSSGTPIEPWKSYVFEKMDFDFDFQVQKITTDEFDREAADLERQRINFIRCGGKITVNELCDKLIAAEGPVMCVMNTTRGASAVAKKLQKKLPAHMVEHISTKLSPKDRRTTLNRVVERLNNNEKFILVGTSCIECGLDLSFRTGFREADQLASVIQTAGRINRHLEYDTSTLFVFELDYAKDGLRPRPEANGFASKLMRLWDRNKTINESMSQKYWESVYDSGLPKLKYDKVTITAEALLGYEIKCKVKTLAQYFKYILDDTVSVLVDPSLDVEDGYDAGKIKDNCVSVYRKQCEKLPIEASKHNPELLVWKGAYDDFIGIDAEFFP